MKKKLKKLLRLAVNETTLIVVQETSKRLLRLVLRR